MSERQESPYDSTARRWLALVERRQQNFIELWNTGRWQHYYTHAIFLDEMRKILDLRNRWALLAGLPVTEQIAIRHSSEPNEQQNRDSSELELRPPTAWRVAPASPNRSGTFGGCSGADLRRWT